MIRYTSQPSKAVADEGDSKRTELNRLNFLARLTSIKLESAPESKHWVRKTQGFCGDSYLKKLPARSVRTGGYAYQHQ